MLSRELKIGILGGVVSSILVIIFIQPILSILWSAVIDFGEYIQAGYVDRIYRNAAIGDRNIVGHLTLLLIVCFLPLIAMGVLIGRSLARASAANALPRYMHIFLAGSLVLIASVAMLGSSISIGVMDLNASFNQRLTIIAPAVGDRELKEWKAGWASMTSQHDYRSLVARLEKRAEELGITLPKMREP